MTDFRAPDQLEEPSNSLQGTNFELPSRQGIQPARKQASKSKENRQTSKRAHEQSIKQASQQANRREVGGVPQKASNHCGTAAISPRAAKREMVAKHRDDPKPPPQMSQLSLTNSWTCHSTPRPTKSHANSSANSLHSACLFFPTADDGNLTSQCSAIRIRAPEEARLRGFAVVTPRCQLLS